MMIGIIAILKICFSKQNGKIPLNSTLVYLFLGTWIIYQTLVNFLFAQNITRSNSVTVWIVLGLFISFYIVKNPNSSQEIISYSLIFACFNSISSFLVWLLAVKKVLPETVGYQIDPIYGDIGVFVSTYEANIFAGLVTVWSLIAMTEYGFILPKKFRLLLIYIAPVVCLLAATRTALLIWVIGVLFLLISKQNWRIFSFLCFVTLISVIFSQIIKDYKTIAISEKFTSVFVSLNQALSYRIETWRIALDDLRSESFLSHGYGMNAFPDMHLDPSQRKLGLGRFLGNIFLQILYSGGLVSLFFVLMAILVILNYRRSKNGFIIFGAYTLLSLITSTLWLAQTWIFLGLALATPKQKSDNHFLSTNRI